MAQDINRVVLIGRLTKDCGSDPNGRDFGYIQQTGTCKATVSIAVNKPKKQGNEWVENVYYFDVVIWGKTAENLKPYLTKGQQILVYGSLVQDRWEKDGQKQSKIYINSESVQLVGGKRDDNSQPQSSYALQNENQQNPFSKPSGAHVFKPVQNQQPTQQEFDSGSDFPEDIPF